MILAAAPIANATLALSPDAKGYLTFMFFVMSYFTIAQSLNCTMVVGIFRSGGDTRFGLIMDVSTMWGFSILVGAGGRIRVSCKRACGLCHIDE